MTRRLLLTGAAGFIGAHCLEHLLTVTDWHIIATDSFRHKGKTDRIADVLSNGPDSWRERITVVAHDLVAPVSSQMISRFGPVDYVIALASGSSVDRSLADPADFIRNNVEIALSTLNYCRAVQPEMVLWISTDEVYGPVIGDHAHPEWAPIIPSNPYSASKAAQESVCTAYWRSYGVPVSIINCMNLIGERQDPEKYLPSLIREISSGGDVGIHGVPGDIGTRYYLHARNLADALVFLLRRGGPAMFSGHRPGQPGAHADRPDRYNVVGPDRLSNLELALMVASVIGKPLNYHLIDFHVARPGHDPHYGLDGTKLSQLGWKPPVPLEESIARIVQWTLRHPEWMLP